MGLRRLLSHAAVHLGLVPSVFLMLLPFLWMLSTSLKTYQAALRTPPAWFPWPPRWENYVVAWTAQPSATYYTNSVIIAVVTTAAEVALAVYAAYAFARLRFLGRGLLFGLFLATLMIPGELLLVPNYLILSRLGWINSYWALIVPWVVSVFAIFLLRQHFLTVPAELYEAAVMDGCGHGRYLWRVMVPLSRPAITTVVLFKFIGSWNSFLWVLIMTNTPNMRTVPTALAAFMHEEGPQYHLWMAAATTALLPVLALFFLAQRQFIEGVARAGLKG